MYDSTLILILIACLLVMCVAVWIFFRYILTTPQPHTINNPPSVPPPVMITDADNNDDVSLLPDQEARVVLPSNPTTGYSWRTVGMTGESVRIEADWTYTPSAPVLIGSGGRSSLVLRAIRPGITTLYLAHDSPFAPADGYTYRVELIVS